MLYRITQRLAVFISILRRTLVWISYCFCSIRWHKFYERLWMHALCARVLKCPCLQRLKLVSGPFKRMCSLGILTQWEQIDLTLPLHFVTRASVEKPKHVSRSFPGGYPQGAIHIYTATGSQFHCLHRTTYIRVGEKIKGQYSPNRTCFTNNVYNKNLPRRHTNKGSHTIYKLLQKLQQQWAKGILAKQYTK